MSDGLTRRGLVGLAVSSALWLPRRSLAGTPFRLGLTPVFLDNDAEVIAQLRAALSLGLGRSIELVQRRTYQEVTGLLLEGSVNAAWLCGYPYLQHEEVLALVGVPVWRGQQLYQSYLITAPDDPATGLSDLAGGIHAFSDPDSNSGWLVTASDLARMGTRPEGFFGRTIFTYGHRNVVRAVASGLTRSGSVDGYVWEVLAMVEPALAERTKVIARSEWLGFPPIVARKDRIAEPEIGEFSSSLQAMTRTDAGAKALALLQLDAIAPGERSLFDGIALRMRDLQAAR
jgi:phosphonate transport system substrate-binding protein